MKAHNIFELIGNTPHLKIDSMFNIEAEIWLKIESLNPGGSIKDRATLYIVEDAEKKGLLRPGSVIIEPSSGNFGLSLAMISAVKGYRLILVLPENTPDEKRKALEYFGAQIELSPIDKGLNGAIAKARELQADIKNSFIPMQFNNIAGPRAHIEYTAQEIIDDFPNGIDYLFCGVGSGSHISGCGAALKKKFPSMKLIAVEPARSSVLSGGKPGRHQISGIGAGFKPRILIESIIDEIVIVEDADAIEFASKLAKKEGLWGGFSTGASLAAIEKKKDEFSEGNKVMAFCYDSAEKYINRL